MRIGIDARLWNETGIGRYIRSLFYHLSEIDKENEYVWFLGKKEFETLEMPSEKWTKVETNVHWHSLSEQIIFPWILYKQNLDLVHFPYFSLPIFYPRKFIVTIHDLIFDHYKTGKASTLPNWLYIIKKLSYHLIVWVSVKRAKYIVTISKDAKSEIIDHYHGNAEKIVVTYEAGTLENVPNSFSDKNFDPMKKMQPYLLYVGNAHPHKNVETLVLAMQKLRQKRTIRLVLIGHDTFFYPKLKEFIEQKNASDYIEVIGSVTNEELAGWYHFATAFVSASKMEGFGIPPLEAMHSGSPVFVSDIPVFQEVYGDAAIFFDQKNPSIIADIIDKTLSNKLLLKSLIEKGYKKVNSYSWKKTVKETAALYKKSL